MKKNIWYFDNFDFHKILCPYKMKDYRHSKPNDVLKKNEFLFMENDPCTDIILIDKGKVKISHYDNDGNEKVIAFLGKGEILGHMAILGENKHRAFAEVMEDGTQVCKLSVDKAKELTRDYMPFAIEINRRIGEHIRKLERRIEILMRKDVRIRLAEFLYDLGQNYGKSKNNGIWITHNLTQSDIATLIGTSRKSASLYLNELENQGIIKFDRKHINIIAPEALSSLISKVQIVN